MRGPAGDGARHWRGRGGAAAARLRRGHAARRWAALPPALIAMAVWRAQPPRVDGAAQVGVIPGQGVPGGMQRGRGRARMDGGSRGQSERCGEARRGVARWARKRVRYKRVRAPRGAARAAKPYTGDISIRQAARAGRAARRARRAPKPRHAPTKQLQLA
ncbi:MAG: hypothetical protein J3K34DRAFT_115286 [Monoraphidium minutum]|nr:MAG: hypothetical protein J3K34DRAFT_115286 [Monoraphidium minutum]